MPEGSLAASYHTATYAPPSREVVADNVKVFRKARLMTQAELGRQAHTSAVVIQMLERAQIPLDPLLQTNVATALGVPAWALVRVLDPDKRTQLMLNKPSGGLRSRKVQPTRAVSGEVNLPLAALPPLGDLPDPFSLISGQPPRSPLAQQQDLANGVRAGDVYALVRQIGLSLRELRYSLNISHSLNTLEKLPSDQRLGPLITERFYPLAMLWAAACGRFGDAEQAREHLYTPQDALGGRRPLDCVRDMPLFLQVLWSLSGAGGHASAA